MSGGRTTRIAVLASGGGSNLGAILGHLDGLGTRRAGDVVLVASDRRDAGALARARDRGLPAVAHATPVRPTGPSLGEALAEHAIDLVVLAGYLRHVPDEVIQRFPHRVINVHPALLPSFGGPGMYGMRVHQAVLASGTTVSGVTVHYVNEVYDRGAIIAQWPVPVLRTDDAARLAARVLRVEHALYPRVVDMVAAGGTSGDPLSVRARADSLFTLSSFEDTDLDAVLSEVLDG